jgi:D-beta-D-heptose 7-phosphate kinase/D-beta-D-heptose 1-phosphate adenosyltransferase
MMQQAAGALCGGAIADDTIADLIPRFAGRTVLVLGDVMLERYVSGEVSRISPEAPIPVLRVTATRASLGGAANVAASGARAILIGVIGTDDAGAEIERLVAAAGDRIEARLFATSRRPTTVKTRFTTRGAHQLLRVDDETIDPLDDRTAAELGRRFARALAESDVVGFPITQKGCCAIGCCAGWSISPARLAVRSSPIPSEPPSKPTGTSRS